MPAPILANDRIRLRLDVDQKTGPLDALRGATPIIWRSADVTFEIGLFFNDEVVDVANLAAVTVEIKAAPSNIAPAPEAAPLATKTVEVWDNTLDAATWSAASKQHASVAFSAEEMNFDLNGSFQWMVVSLLTTAGKVLTASAGLIDVREDGFGGGAGSAPVIDGTAYSKAQSDALFMPRGGAGFRFAGGFFQLRDIGTDAWRGLFLVDGVLSFTGEDPADAPGDDLYRFAGNYLQLKDTSTGGWRSLFLEDGELSFGDEEVV